MNRAYDSLDADRLIPLLRSVQREIRERSDHVRGLRVRLANLPRTAAALDEQRALQAELAIHKLEIRLARKELKRLGCAIDDERPERVLIPGVDGDLARGFAWSFGEGHVRSSSASSSDPCAQSEQAA